MTQYGFPFVNQGFSYPKGMLNGSKARQTSKDGIMFTHTIRLRDRTVVTVRPARPHDWMLIEEMHDRLSDASLYFRYMRYSKPTCRELRRLCRMDRHKGSVLVATVDEPGETVIGLAYYVIEEGVTPLTAEPALLVEDRFQGKGLGTRLFHLLSEAAQQQGIAEFQGIVYGGNEMMMQVLRRSGLPLESNFAYGMREVRIHIGQSSS